MSRRQRNKPKTIRPERGFVHGTDTKPRLESCPDCTHRLLADEPRFVKKVSVSAGSVSLGKLAACETCLGSGVVVAATQRDPYERRDGSAPTQARQA
jgi:hypothetical protein